MIKKTTFFILLLLLISSLTFSEEVDETADKLKQKKIDESIFIDIDHPLLINNYDISSDDNPFEGKCLPINIVKKYQSAYMKSKIIIETDSNGDQGYLNLEYNIKTKRSIVAYKLDFKGNDFTYFDKFTFRIKGDPEFGYSDKFKVELASWNERLHYTLEGVTDEWKQYTIFLSDFKGDQIEEFNWESVEWISFIFENELIEQKNGKYLIDDIYIIPKKDTSLTLWNIKEQKYLKSRGRLFGFPDDIIKKIDLNMKDKDLLKEIAKDTWKFFKNVIDKNTYLVMDNITVRKKVEDCKVADFTNITNIGLQFLVVLAAYDFKFISKKEAINIMEKLVNTIKGIAKWEGLSYNYYRTKDAVIANQYISSVDNGWLAAGLICLRNSFGGKLKKEATSLLDQMKFGKLYSKQHGQLYLGYMADKKQYSQYHYGLLCTEPRVTSLIGIGKGDVPQEHWFRIYRTLPQEWDWQRQIPEGKKKNINGVEFFGGYYKYGDEKYVPSWGGSMFETLMPLIVIDEEKWMPKSMWANDRAIAKLHIKYSKENGYKYWGYSPCSTPQKDKRWWGYHEFGIPVLGAKGYEPLGIVTPHAMILPLLAGYKEEVMDNLRSLLKEYPGVYGEYGLYDSVDTINNRITKKYLALDQGMLFIALCNYINKGSIQKRFEKDEIFKNVIELIGQEDFFN